MKIISIDVGIKNLSYCILDVSTPECISIIKWEIVNLITTQPTTTCTQYDSKTLKKTKKPNSSQKSMDSFMPTAPPLPTLGQIACKYIAKFTKYDNAYCARHAKKSGFITPTKETKRTFINKQRVGSLHDLTEKYNIDMSGCKKSGKPTRQEMVDALLAFFSEKCLDPVTPISANTVSLVTISQNLVSHFDKICSGECGYEHIHSVIIENQLANRMQTIQGMIAQLFAIKNASINVEFISPANKLKGCNSGTTTYEERKKQSIEICLETLCSSAKFEGWEKYVKDHKKKDDLADAFLQGMWYISQQTLV
jgi:hypothetical protein